MKKYSSKKAKKGKTAYRTPSDVKYKLVLKNKFQKEKK